jgi:Ca-activated chloride channel homolog
MPANRTIALLCLLTITTVLWTASAETPSAAKSGETPTIRVDVEMISMPVVVTDRTGKRITDLKQEDFQIFEDGVPQEISGFASTDEPIEVALLLDTSGSTELKLARIQNSAIDFVHQLHPDDEVAILSFAQEAKLQYDFTIDRSKNEYGIKKTRPGGCTAAYEAVWLALEDVLKPIRERKALVIFSDGVDTCSSKASINETLDLSKETRATIYSVYYNTEEDEGKIQRRNSTGYPGQNPSIVLNPFPPIIGTPGSIPGTRTTTNTGASDPESYMRGNSYLKDLAENSGGRLFNGNTDLNGAFSSIAQELASQYSIGYYSTNTKHDGKFHKIQIKLKKPDLVARTKKGYYAPKEKKASSRK